MMNEIKVVWVLIILAGIIFTATKIITVDTLWMSFVVFILAAQLATRKSKHDE